MKKKQYFGKNCFFSNFYAIRVQIPIRRIAMKKFLLFFVVLSFLSLPFIAETVEDPLQYKRSRENMISTQIRMRGISDKNVLAAMSEVPRHLFVPKGLIAHAYSDRPLPIGQGQTISQPYIIALMTESLNLKGDERVLEVGTGSGYQAAILAKIAKEVHTIEVKEKLYIKGAIEGKLAAGSKMFIDHTARIKGKLFTPVISVVEGAQFNGELKMVD